MHHTNPFRAAVGWAVSTRMSGNKKDWPKRDPTCTLIHSHCHSVDLAILFCISIHYIKVWIEFLSGNYSFEDHSCFITLQLNYSVSPIYGRRRLYTTVCLDKSHHTLRHPAIFGEHQIIGQQLEHLTDCSISHFAIQGAFHGVDQKHQPNHH